MPAQAQICTQKYTGGYRLSGRKFAACIDFAEAVGAMTATGLTAESATQMIDLGEDQIGAVVVELVGPKFNVFL